MICIAGKNEIAINATNYLLNRLCINKSNIVCIPNHTDKGKDNWQPSFAKYCIDNRLDVVKLTEIYQIPDLIFLSLEFDKIIPTHMFLSGNLYNIHFSLLPKYKGMYTSIWPILNGENKTGVTLHKIDDGIDTGPIIDQIDFEIGLNFTARDLYFEYLNNSFVLFKNNIINLLKNSVITKSQSNVGSYYSKNSLDFRDIKIDLNKTSFEIHNQIRAFIFKEYQYPIVNYKNIIKSELTNEIIDKNYFETTNNGFIISGIDGYKIILNCND